MSWIEVKGVRLRREGLDPETVRYLERKLARARRHERRAKNLLFKLLQRVLPKACRRGELKPGALGRVLVVGCGGGLEAVAIGAVGIDNRFEAVRMASELRDHAEKGAGEFLAASGGDLPFLTGAFDALLSDNVVEHLPGPVLERHLREAHRVLRPGGTYAISTPNRLFEDPPELGHCSLHSYAEWEAMLLEAGFTQVRTPHYRSGPLEDLEWKKVQERRAAEGWFRVGISNLGLRLVTLVASR